MLSKLSIRRLTKLRDHMLHNVKDEKFNFAHWVSAVAVGNAAFYGEAPPSCGMIACAGGHACGIPSFRKAGLKLERFDDRLCPSFRTHKGTLALSAFFDITVEEADYLFLPFIGLSNGLSEGASRLQLVDHLTRFIQDGMAA
jgi:hypothetical protein